MKIIDNASCATIVRTGSCSCTASVEQRGLVAQGKPLFRGCDEYQWKAPHQAGFIIFATTIEAQQFAWGQKQAEGKGSQPYFHRALHLTAVQHQPTASGILATGWALFSSDSKQARCNSTSGGQSRWSLHLYANHACPNLILSVCPNN